MANKDKFGSVSLPVEFIEKLKTDAKIRQTKQSRPKQPSSAEMIQTNYKREDPTQ